MKTHLLEKAIKQAIKGGWDCFGWPDYTVKELPSRDGADVGDLGMWVGKKKDGTGIWISVEEIIFDHDFAKAFWGEEMVDRVTGKTNAGKDLFLGRGTHLKRYQYHLQEQVISDDPVKYLERGLK